VARRFRLNPAGSGPQDPWFRIGTLDVSTTVLVTLLVVVSFVVFAVEPIDKPLMNALAMKPQAVLEGQVWRVATWPFSCLEISLWSAINVFLFWYFGSDLESNLLGRSRFLWLFAGFTLSLGLLGVALHAVLQLNGWLYGIDQVQLMVLLAWVAEWPQRRFLFNIPAWVVGVVIVGIQVLQLVGYRMWFPLLDLVLGLVLCALVARSVGMLADYTWIPHLHWRHRTRRERRARRAHPAGRGDVVTGPWKPHAVEPPVSKDQARIDALLDKINHAGSLTEAEQRELRELSERRRRG
jgi:hypothetical protein